MWWRELSLPVRTVVGRDGRLVRETPEWLAAEPAVLVERALRSDVARPVLEGWVEATARFGDPVMAEALLASPAVAEAIDGPDIASVLDGIGNEQRAALVAEVASRAVPSILPRLLRRCAAPWPVNLGRSVIGVLAASSAVAYPEPWFFEVARIAATAIPVALAEDLATALAYRDQVRPTLAGTLETLDLRRALHAAFAAPGRTTT
jgi:hypothetical protein